MLKSTHKSTISPASLFSPWTEHVAPSGHVYYYNTETKLSTYTRPTEAPSNVPETNPSHSGHLSASVRHEYPSTLSAAQFDPPLRSRQSYRNTFHRTEDRPKTKHTIPECVPWLLVKTKLGRRFVHNPVTNESYWRIPKDVIGGVKEYDSARRRGNEQAQALKAEPAATNGFLAPVEGNDPMHMHEVAPEAEVEVEKEVVAADDRALHTEIESGDAYEEVEVTDDEGESVEGRSVKRLRTEELDDTVDQGIAFSEEDMLRQLELMGETHHLEADEYGNDELLGDWDNGNNANSLTERELNACFMDLLDDFNVNPYTTWENVLAEGLIIEDDRYTMLPNMRSRKEVFTEWSIIKIQQNKLAKEHTMKEDPRIPYLTFIEKHASPKLFWAEFRRKFKKDHELKDARLTDKEREKLYREYIQRITKVSEVQRSRDLETLLRSMKPSQTWNRATNIESGLPQPLLADVRFISVPAQTRDALIKSHIYTLPAAD